MEMASDVTPLCYLPAVEEPEAAIPNLMRNGMKADVARIIEAAQSGWLTKYQVMYILEHWKALGLTLSTTTPHLPQSTLPVWVEPQLSSYCSALL
jgi:hypothetical protein